MPCLLERTATATRPVARLRIGGVAMRSARDECELTAQAVRDLPWRLFSYGIDDRGAPRAWHDLLRTRWIAIALPPGTAISRAAFVAAREISMRHIEAEAK